MSPRGNFCCLPQPLWQNSHTEIMKILRAVYHYHIIVTRKQSLKKTVATTNCKFKELLSHILRSDKKVVEGLERLYTQGPYGTCIQL